MKDHRSQNQAILEIITPKPIRRRKNMIGKKLYKAKIRDNKVVIEEKTVVAESPKKKKWLFDEEKNFGCFKTDVGVVCFLDKREALSFLKGSLIDQISNGETYISILEDRVNEINDLISVK